VTIKLSKNYNDLSTLDILHSMRYINLRLTYLKAFRRIKYFIISGTRNKIAL